jgi:hypothetical protein
MRTRRRWLAAVINPAARIVRQGSESLLVEHGIRVE